MELFLTSKLECLYSYLKVELPQLPSIFPDTLHTWDDGYVNDGTRFIYCHGATGLCNEMQLVVPFCSIRKKRKPNYNVCMSGGMFADMFVVLATVNRLLTNMGVVC